MDIILLENIEKVGAKHDVVKVKDGYGRNYLLPRGLALVANKSNLASLAGLKRQAAKKEAASIEAAKAMAAKAMAASIVIAAKAGESGRLFGSVTAQHLASALKNLGIEVDKRNIEMPDEVKDLGVYSADVKFHREVEAKIKFEVVAE